MMTTSPNGGGSGDINREETRQWMECLLLHEARMKEEEEAEAKRQHRHYNTAESVQQKQCKTQPPAFIETDVCARGTGDHHKSRSIH
jgi:hypothetical protein